MNELLDQIDQARTVIEARASVRPRVGMILGSGLGSLADELEDAAVIPYAHIPGFAPSTVIGHRSELALGHLAGQPVAVMRGRFHFYEGYSMQQVTFPVRVLRALGCDTLIATNAAGCMRPDWGVGELMLLRDHIFLPGMAGHHPLRGPNDEQVGPRFPPMVGAFRNELAEFARQAAAEQGVTLREGVYVMVSGPTYESAAELRMLQICGADAVGMSTAPEIVVALHAGMRVLGISLLTNMALPEGEAANHAEVLSIGEAAKPGFAAVLRGVLGRMDTSRG
jgi:purine-nucleoside phosphorylase